MFHLGPPAARSAATKSIVGPAAHLHGPRCDSGRLTRAQDVRTFGIVPLTRQQANFFFGSKR